MSTTLTPETITDNTPTLYSRGPAGRLWTGPEQVVMMTGYDEVEGLSPHVDTPCWIYRGCKNAYGYGQVAWLGRKLLAHRVMWEVRTGRAVPAGMHVMHRCDQRGCIAPTHLTLGTIQDNMGDMAAKGRVRRGRTMPPALVRTLRSEYAQGEKVAVIARRYGLRYVTAYRVVTGQRYRSVA